jgi:hypothetical protein
MILLLSTKYQRLTAYFFFLVFTLVLIPISGNTSGKISRLPVREAVYPSTGKMKMFAPVVKTDKVPGREVPEKNSDNAAADHKPEEAFIGGPSQPEMNRFKPAGADNMVNLFTGDFSYNIPLLDVGGYPVNIFYDGGITPEQDASWVGLGWNINPGTVGRNMRGVPDDFDGTEKIRTTQMMKPNITWGGKLSPDFENIGIKKLPNFVSAIGGIGISINNYLGPALEFDFNGGTGFNLSKLVGLEKIPFLDTMTVNASVNVNLNSRGGMTIQPNVSLSATKEITDKKFIGGGVGLSTSYNSRTGISNLNLNGQMQASYVQSIETQKKSGYHTYTGSIHIGSTSISFARPAYTPSIRMPVTNHAFSGRFKLGAGLWGMYVSGETEVYKHTATVEQADRLQEKPMVGYMYYDKANNDQNAVLDFTRYNDKEVTQHTPVISVPQYTYDVFTINGEGTGGSIRLYRNDLGSVRDNYTSSRSKSSAIGVDVGFPGHYGANVNLIKTPTTSGEWTDGNKLKTAIPFESSAGMREAVFFRNPGETSVLDNDQFNKIGGTDLVRFKLGGTSSNPTIEPVLERFSPQNVKLPDVVMNNQPGPANRMKRTQVVSFLTARELSVPELNKKIRTYNSTDPLNENRELSYREIDRVSEFRKGNHISQIEVTEATGMRYIYDIPVYNTNQQELTFTVGGDDPDNEVVNFDPADATEQSPWLKGNARKDGYFQKNETPPYAHSFLLGGLLSPDYVDVSNNGITEDDLGTAVKFNYTRIENAGNNTPVASKWRTPHGSGSNTGIFNAGSRTNAKDDKASITYGERESWYMHSIESKTMVALFTLEDRKDAKGPVNINGGRANDTNAAKRLKKIDLYSKADLKKNGLTGANRARPIKSVFFEYSYQLCKNSPDNSGAEELRSVNNVPVNVNANKGRLTLERIYFTFNGQDRASKNQYKFAYENPGAPNPDYAINTSDRWGNYKPKDMNPGELKNADYPYSFQPANQAQSTLADHYAGAWSLKKILLPSGGQIEVQYESDDYAFVQDRRASVMMKVAGFGSSNNSFSNSLYTINGMSIAENKFVLIDVTHPCNTKEEVYERYLKGQEQFAFRLAVKMPDGGYEYLTSYGMLDNTNNDGYGIYGSPADKKIWIKLKLVEGRLSPLSVTALEYLKEQLPGQAFPGYDLSEGTTLQQIGGMFSGVFNGLMEIFRDPLQKLRSNSKARYTDLTKCFVRLNEPMGKKLGGGHRVKQVLLKDNWNAMTNQFTSSYGTSYNYSTTEVLNSKTRTISSGVASYEPTIGGEENPMQVMLQVVDRLPLGPSSYGAIEMPVLDAFFPAPVVGYSKVTVTTLKKGNIPADKKSRSGIGRQVTEFYTAKDFPVKYQHTSLGPTSDKQLHQNSFGGFFWKWSMDFRSISQGFLVVVNDMHGKLKSQSSYAENDTTQRISYTENFYRNTGVKNMAEEKFSFVSGKDGRIEDGNMGIDVELYTDTREFSVKTRSQDLQAQNEAFPVFGAPVWLPFPWYVGAKNDNIYRAVTCTKYVSYHSVIDRVVVIDKGSQVESRNLVYDKETGAVIINSTINEFEKPIYSTNYPAYWAYEGMGLAYKNIGATFSGINFLNGKITTGNAVEVNFESGDELYVISSTDPVDECGASLNSGNLIKRIWVLDQNKTETGLTPASHDYVYIDEKGAPYTRSNVRLKIIRSGRRNMLGASVASASSMTVPYTEVSGERRLRFTPESKVVNSSAMTYREKWHIDRSVINKYVLVYDPVICGYKEVPDCSGYLEKSINPYQKGLLGNFRNDKGYVFYLGRTADAPAAQKAISDAGYLVDFVSFWDFDANNKFKPVESPKWVWTQQVTRFNARGMELETKDAMQIYSSALYGYSRSLPLAITQNARYFEMGYDGFEDHGFIGDLNKTAPICADDPFTMKNFTNAQVVEAAAISAIKPHSGKKMLEVTGSVAQKTFPVKNETVVNYLLPFTPKVMPRLVTRGVNITNIDKSANLTLTLNEGDQTFTLMANPQVAPVGGVISYGYNVDATNYIQVPQNGTYTINTMVQEKYNAHSDFAAITFAVKTLDGLNMPYTLTQTGSMNDRSYEICLPKGIYQIFYYCHSDYNAPYTGAQLPNQEFIFYFSGPAFIGYKEVDYTNGCNYSEPIKADPSMFNTDFSIPVNEKMLISTWVRESCTAPCNKTTYTNSQLTVLFDNGEPSVVLTPSGPIIEGWQRVEGVFTATAGATQATLRINNSSGSSIYVDDVRIHPYNANMQSYVYDPASLRLTAQLDANNYATFYDYDEDGGLIRTKVETKEGVKVISETRSAKQKTIKEIQ